jgi:LPXTG-site transpeptidase (sortase) family protein
VTSSTPGVYTNTIPADAITTQEGVTNGSPASAPLNVQPVGISKGFSPSSFQAGDTTTLTITLRNPTASAFTGVSISDTLPGTVLTVVDGSATTTCGGTASTTLPRTVTLTGGTIPGGSTSTPGTCTISVQVTAPPTAGAASYTNTIPAESLVTDQGVTNVLPATAQVRVYAVGTGINANKNFNPSTIDVGGNSRLRINITAPADTALTNFSLTDNLPTGVVISNSSAPFVSPNCGPNATLTVVTGTSVINLTNATIEAGVQCFVDVWVTSDTPDTYLNIITPSNITNDQNRTPSGNLTATLIVLPLSDLSASKSFVPGAISPLGISTLTITLQNTNASPLVDVSVLDNLPADLTVASTPNASTTCAGGTVTAVPGTQAIQLTGGSLPAQVAGVPGVCTINVNVRGSSNPGTYNNTIPASNISGTVLGTGTTINPTRDATAPLVVSGLTLGLVKGFQPLTVFGGSASTMSVDLINPNDAGLSNIGFTDNMPAGMFLANPPNFSEGTCGGTLTGTPGEATFTFSGGSLPAKSLCTLTISVTMNVNGNLTNVIQAGAVTTQEGASNPEPAEATLTNLAGASVSKFFAPNPVAVGTYSLLTVTIRNTGTLPLTGMGLIDNLPAGLAIASPPAPAPVNNCGGTLTAVSGSQVIQLTDGVLAPASDCTMVVAVVGASPGEYENIIPSGSLITDPAITNTQPAIDTLVVTDSSDGGGPDRPDRPSGGGVLIPVTGFAPGRVTDLSDLPVTRYNALNGVRLEIPVLKLNLPIVGVPMGNKTWDVNWLLNQVGWLEGSAFPGYSGNSVLTSHVTLPYGQAGPFADLHKLKLGDKIFVHSFGDLYIYEIKSFSERYATDPAILQHESKSWLTLVTCTDYDEQAGTYRKRLVFKAALLQIQPDY